MDDADEIEKPEINVKSGIPRSTSRPSSRPMSRPTPSARVRALGKDDLDEVDRNSQEEEEEEEDDDEDEEEEDEEQGIQVEGIPSKLCFYRPATPVMRHQKSKNFSQRRRKNPPYATVHSSSKLSDDLSLSLSDCSIGDEIVYDSYYDTLEDERDLLYQELPYSSKRAYDPADYEHLAVSSEMKELFQYITRYTPQTIELDHKLRPFIPEYIPAVGDIDAFIKVPRPDNEPDKLGLIALDEPCAKQSDPTVLDLQLRAITKETTSKAVAVKKLKDADKRPKEIEAWINSIANLHQSKPPPTVHYAKTLSNVSQNPRVLGEPWLGNAALQYVLNMPDIEALMQEWPPEFEESLKEAVLPTADLDCSLEEYVDIVCGLLDIPVYKSRIQSLHLLFSLYLEFKNSQHFKSLARNEDGDELVDDYDDGEGLSDDDVKRSSAKAIKQSGIDRLVI